MRIENIKGFNRLMITDEDGEVPNSIICLYGRSGFGKSLGVEALIEEYHKGGYLVIILTDVKDEIEMGYAMFKPKAQYHLNILKKEGKEPTAVPVELYHPFTFNIPKRDKLPPINFFTHSIKDLTREELSLIAETSSDKETIRLLMNHIDLLSKEDGLFKLIYNLNRNIGASKGTKRSKDSFGQDYGQGSITNLKEIISYFNTYVDNFFIAPDNFDLNLSVQKIFRNQGSYHLLIQKWIKDDKIKSLNILLFLNFILRNIDSCKYPILFVIEEIGNLTPFKAVGYGEYLANAIRPKIKTIRNKGRGCSMLLNNQVWFDVDDKVKEYVTDTFLGRLAGISDINRIAKSLKYQKDIVNTLKSLDRNCFMKLGEEDETSEGMKFLFPKHCHAEEKYNFFEMFKKEYPDKLKDYSELFDFMKIKRQEQELMVERLQKLDKEEIKKAKAKTEAEKKTVSKLKEELVESKKKIKEVQKMSKDELIVEARKLKLEGKSLREIGKLLKKDHKTVKAYIDLSEPTGEPVL